MARILVVAKDVLVRCSLKDILIANGLAVDVSSKHDEFSKLIKERGYKLLIVDSSSIKDFQNISDIPVLFLCDVFGNFKGVGKNYLIKPLRISEFSKKVQEVIRSSDAVNLKVKWSACETLA